MANESAVLYGWYYCAPTPAREAYDYRMETWSTSLSNQVPKLFYDVVWQAAGGTVGDACYNRALYHLRSTIQQIPDGQGGTIDVVESSTLMLSRFLPAWIARPLFGLPCQLVTPYIPLPTGFTDDCP